LPHPAVEELAGQSSGGGPSGGGPSSDRGSRAAAVERSRQTGLDPWESGGTELFITEESIGKIEEILDTWSNHLKVGVLQSTCVLMLLLCCSCVLCPFFSLLPFEGVE